MSHIHSVTDSQHNTNTNNQSNYYCTLNNSIVKRRKKNGIYPHANCMPNSDSVTDKLTARVTIEKLVDT